MLLGVIADDFTGATDIANTLTKGLPGSCGLMTTLFLGVPSKSADPACQAGVVALKSRSIGAADSVRQSVDALRWLQAQGCRQIFFKYCSTFDSTPAGNIGPVADALSDALNVSGIVVCPAFPTAGRTLYNGNLFVDGVPLAESSMRAHPLTPMTDSNLCRWLGLQTEHPVGLVPWEIVRRGSGAIRNALDAAAARGERLIVVDAITDEDLVAIGRSCADAPLLTGGSGLALGLPDNILRWSDAVTDRRDFPLVSGPEAILAGSCSKATLAQIARHRISHPAVNVSVADVMTGKVDVERLAAFVRENSGRAPLIYSSSEPEQVVAAQTCYGTDAVAKSLDALFADLACRLVEGGLARLVVAGGETSGAVVSALHLDALRVGPEIAPGVPVVATHTGPTLALALKSGNFGGPDFFEQALRMMDVGPAVSLTSPGSMR